MIDDSADEVLIATREDWVGQAACRGIAASVFFTERGEMTAPAKAICAACPVTAECLDYALRTKQKFGIWGGKSERERRTMRRDLGYSVRVPNGRYAEVARIARHCVGTNVAAADAVAELMGVDRPAASMLISRARRAGHEIPYDYRASA